MPTPLSDCTVFPTGTKYLEAKACLKPRGPSSSHPGLCTICAPSPFSLLFTRTPHPVCLSFDATSTGKVQVPPQFPSEV